MHVLKAIWPFSPSATIGKVMAVNNLANARIRHIAKTCLSKDKYSSEVREAAAEEWKVRQQKKSEPRQKYRAQSAGATAAAAAATATAPANTSVDGRQEALGLEDNEDFVREPRLRHRSVSPPAPPPLPTGTPITSIPRTERPFWKSILYSLPPAPTAHDTNKNRAFAAKLLKRDPNSLHVDGRRFRCPNWDSIDEQKPPFAINSFAGTGGKVYTYCPPVRGCPAVAERSEAPDEMAWWVSLCIASHKHY